MGASLQLARSIVVVGFSLLLVSCKSDLTRDVAAKMIAPNIEGRVTQQEAITLSFHVECWVPSQRELILLAEQYRRGMRRLPGVLEQAFRQKLVANVTPAAFLVSPTKGYIYSDCFGVDMTPKNNFNGYPSNYLNLQAGAFKIELVEEIKKDIQRTESKPVFVGFAYSNSNVIGTSVVIALSKQHFIGVTGITEANKNARIVSFAYSIVPTETGKKLRDIREERRSGNAVFVKYDDGWRLQSLDR